MWRWIIGIVLALGIMILAIGAYLGPDDLRMCQATPSGHAPCGKADAIVAISGGDTRARTTEAISLYQHGWAKKIIFSGAAFDPDSPSNADVMRQQALESGVPVSAIVLDTTSRSTQQNASNTSTIFEQNDIKSVILVTSAYHQRRAYLEFKKYSPEVAVRNHPIANDDQWSGLWWLTPQGWWLAGGELVKIMAFYMGDSR